MKKLFLTPVLLCSVLFAAFSQPKAAPNPDFDPNFSAVMPVIKITSETGKNDFVTKPVAKHVTEQRKTWGDIRNDPAPYYEKCKVTVINGNTETELSDVEAKVKVRGNWTTDYPKKSLRIRFSEKQPLLGMNGGQKNKDWVLLNTYKDWSFMRDSTGLYLGKMICPGYTSDFKLAEIYINEQYWGVYVVAELQEVCKDRVNITEPKKDYKGTDIGYFVEYDSYYLAEKNNFTFKSKGALKDIKGKSVNVPKDAGYAIKNEINSDEQKAFIANFVENVWKICYESVYKKNFLEFDSDYKSLVKSDASNVYDCVSKVIDIDSMVAAYILAELTCDPDLYYSSFYFTVDFGPEGDKKIYFEAPWDFDSTMGNKNFCADGKQLHAALKQWDVNHKTQDRCNPWMMVFVNEDWFQDAVKEKWHAIQADKPLEKLLANIDFATENYQQNFTADQKVWKNIGKNDTVGNELCKESANCKNQKQAAERLKKWLNARFAYLDSIW